MKRCFLLFSGQLYRKGEWLLNCCWIVGWVGGIATAVYCRDCLVQMTSTVVYSHVSISGLLIAGFLPLLFSSFAVSFSESWILPIVGGVKVFSFGFCACAVGMTFGQSGWLIRMLLLFTDCFTVPAFYFFSLRHISGRTSRVRRDIAVFFAFITVVCLIDYSLVSPFLLKLFR